MGSRNWIINRDHQYRNAYPCFALLDAGLTLQPALTSLQSSHIVHCVYDKGLPHLEPVHANYDHDHQS